MGLLSVLNVILEKSMEEALEMVKVASEIKEALISGSGKLSPVLNLMQQYENANWQEVSRLLLLAKIDVDLVNDAYKNSLRWYRDLTYGKK